MAASAMPVLPLDGSRMVWPGLQATALLGVLDHRLGDAVLDRAERVLAFELGDDAHVGIRRQPADVDHRSVADHVEHIFERNHHHP